MIKEEGDHFDLCAEDAGRNGDTGLEEACRQLANERHQMAMDLMEVARVEYKRGAQGCNCARHA